MSLDTMAIPTAVVSLVVAVVGFLLSRSIGAIDRALATISSKVDALSNRDSVHSEAIVELKVRVATLERELLYAQRDLRRHQRDEEPRP